MTMDKTALGPQMVVWAEALCTGKANPYPECLLQQKQNCPFYVGSGPT